MVKAIIVAYVQDPARRGRLWQYAHEAVSGGTRLICADSGGGTALNWGLKPDVVVGDLDSIASADLARLKELGVPVQAAQSEKDETDLELALYTALEAGATDLTILGGLGGRLDHTLGNLYLLAAPRLMEAGVKVRLLAEREEVFLLRGGERLELAGQTGELLSLLPLSAQAVGIRTEGLYYPLQAETLYLGLSRGLSNLFTASSAHISLDQGLLLVIHTFAT